jgi:hypothetical protein
MPSFTFLVMYFYLPELIKPMNMMVLLMLFFITFVIPLLGFSMFKLSGQVTSWTLDKREERLLPFSFVGIFYGLNTYLFVTKIQINDTITLMLFSSTVLILLLTFITYWYKISIHAAGISGVVGYFIVFGLDYPDTMAVPLLYGIMVLAGLIMSARLQLNAHTPNEIFAGCLTGVSVCFNILYWFD